MEKLFEFFKLTGCLKSTLRTGWVKREVQSPESIASHMYRMSLMSFVAEDNLDKNKLIKLSLVHDLAESIVGDITPTCPVTKEEKYTMEKNAMEHIKSLLSEEVGQEIHDLWMEYEGGQSKEAIFVKDLDRFDMILQAEEYEEKQAGLDLQEFFDSTKSAFKSDQVKEWVSALYKLRDKRKNKFQNNELS